MDGGQVAFRRYFSLAFGRWPGVKELEQIRNKDAMSDTSGLIQSYERLRAQAIAALVPFFLGSPASDANTARAVAVGLLDEYKAATPKELQLATQIVALGWASLACLGAAAAVKNVSLEGMLDLQDVAIALNRSSLKATKALQARRKERAKNPAGMTAENTRWDEGAFQLVINQALDAFHEASAKLAAYMAALEPEAAKAAADPAAPKINLALLSAEPMTGSVLARRAGLT
jgi:hypothetical protein